MFGWLAATATIAHAVFPAPQFPGYLDKQEISINTSDYPAYHINIPINHYNVNDTRTYKNRYWVNAEHYKPGGPVFYFDAGEQNAAPRKQLQSGAA